MIGLLAGCDAPAAPAPAPDAEKKAPAAVAERPTPAPASSVEPPFRPLEIPAPSGESDRQVSVILDAPHLKIASIALRRGTPLPEHTAPVPVVIQAASGAGTVLLGEQRVRIDATHFVTLAPNEPHAVEPDAGADLTLLVFHLRGGK